MQIWARGEGGFGGDAGPRSPPRFPSARPTRCWTRATSTQQALVYRLSADMNPLHADPSFAQMAGFDRPILHGLASYGVVCKAVVDGVLGGDPARVQSFSVRFAGSIYPGETIETSGLAGRGHTDTARHVSGARGPAGADPRDHGGSFVKTAGPSHAPTPTRTAPC